MTNRTRFLSLVVSALPMGAAWAAGETSGRIWTLADASRHAAREAVAAKIAAETLLVSQAGEDRAFARLFPELRFDSGHAWNYANPSGRAPGDTFWTSQAALTATASIYDNGARWNDWQLSKLVLEESRASTERSRQEALYNLTQAWLDYSYQLEAWAAEREEFQLLERQYRSTEAQNRGGLRTQQDLLRIRIPYQRSRLSLDTAGESVLAARRKLAVLMDLDPSGDFAMPGPEEKITPVELGSRLGFRPLDLSRLPEGLAESAPGSFAQLERRAAELQSREAELSQVRARRALWPELNLSASGGYAKSGYLYPEAGTASESGWQAAARVDLNWSIWDFGALRADARAAGARAHLARLNERQKDIEATSREADLRLEFARLKRQGEQTAELRRMEETNYQNLATRYREGRIGYLDLINGLESLSRSRLSYMQVSRDLRARAAQLAFEEGRIHETIDKL